MVCAISMIDSFVDIVSIWVVRDSSFAVIFWRRAARASSCSDMVGSGENTVIGERSGEADLDDWEGSENVGEVVLYAVFKQ